MLKTALIKQLFYLIFY